jgi:hypothetical protein
MELMRQRELTAGEAKSVASPFDSLRSLRAFDSLRSDLTSHLPTMLLSDHRMACHERAQQVEWRRRELNENVEICNDFSPEELHSVAYVGVAQEHRFPDIGGHCESSGVTESQELPQDVRRLVARWVTLPPHVRETIMMLVDAIPMNGEECPTSDQ